MPPNFIFQTNLLKIIFIEPQIFLRIILIFAKILQSDSELLQFRYIHHRYFYLYLRKNLMNY